MEDNIRVDTEDLLYIAAKLADLAIELEDLSFRVRAVCMQLPPALEDMVLLDLLRERTNLLEAMDRSLNLRRLLRYEVDDVQANQEWLCVLIEDGLMTGMKYEDYLRFPHLFRRMV